MTGFEPEINNHAGSTASRSEAGHRCEAPVIPSFSEGRGREAAERSLSPPFTVVSCATASILRLTCLLNRAEEAREAFYPLGGLPMRNLIGRIGRVELVTPDRHVSGAMGSQG